MQQILILCLKIRKRCAFKRIKYKNEKQKEKKERIAIELNCWLFLFWQNFLIFEIVSVEPIIIEYYRNLRNLIKIPTQWHDLLLVWLIKRTFRRFDFKSFDTFLVEICVNFSFCTWLIEFFSHRAKPRINLIHFTRIKQLFHISNSNKKIKWIQQTEKAVNPATHWNEKTRGQQKNK